MHQHAGVGIVEFAHPEDVRYEDLSFLCVRPYTTGVGGLKVLVYAALSYLSSSRTLRMSGVCEAGCQCVCVRMSGVCAEGVFVAMPPRPHV
jgi:hypothetical protein